MILMWSCPGNMPKYYPGLRDILPDPQVICQNITEVLETYYPLRSGNMSLRPG